MIRTSTTILIWISLTTASYSQPVQAKLERLIELRGLPSASVPVITALAIHPSGHLLATAGDDHLVRIWDIRDGQLIRKLRGHRDWITAVAFSDDGQELITGSRDRRVVIWDVGTGKPVGVLGRSSHPISSITVGPQDRIAIAGFRAPLRLYDLKTRRLKRQVKCPCSDTRAVAFSSDLALLAAGGRNGVVRVWNLAQDTHYDIPAHQRRIRSILFANDRTLVTAGDAAEIGVWNLASRNLSHRIPNTSGKVLSMTMISDEQFAASGSDNVIRLFRLNGSGTPTVLQGHTGSIAALTASNGRLISGSFDTTIRIWAMSAADRPTDSALSTRVISTASPN